MTQFFLGYVFVNTGLIAAASNEAELAAVLANAIAHVAAHHTAQVMAKSEKLQLAAIPALAVAWHWFKMEPQRIELQGILSECESEADQLAIQYLWNSGYDPATYVRALQMLPAGRANGQERIRSATTELRSLPARRPYVLDSVEFEIVKSHILNRR